ncbi:MAG TPA: hypothetical protein VF412_01065 [Bdellovibrio sp.]|uniref:hypothetical protein n=1 Tax=Bdellovibrio sp. TaxID=28201 RepID=UPI002F0F3265
MKTFTNTQKQWAMASALLLVLGFNVSFNSHTGGVASLELASEDGDVIPSKITTSNGVANVKYIKTGDHEVLALVPKVTEGKGYCEDCGFNKYTLNVAFDKNAKDIDALNVALLKKIDEQKTIAPIEAKPSTTVSADADVKPKPKKPSFTDRVLKKCGDEKKDVSADTLECRVNEISSILDDEKVDQKEVTAFYAKYVQQFLAKQIASDDQDANQAALDQLTGLQDSLTQVTGWKELRTKIGQTLANSIGYAGNTLKTFYTNYQTALNAKDLNASQYWMQMYQAGQSNIFNAKNNFQRIETGWANTSLQQQAINYADLNNVVWAYTTPADQIYAQIVASPQTFTYINGQIVTTGPGANGSATPGTLVNPNTATVVQLPDGTLVAPRLAAGRGVVVKNPVAVSPNGAIVNNGTVTTAPTATSNQYTMVGSSCYDNNARAVVNLSMCSSAVTTTGVTILPMANAAARTTGRQ